MKLIDVDALKDKVLEWMPSDPCGIEEKEIPFETDIVVSLMMEIEEAPSIDIPTWIPCSERLPERLERVLVTRANGRVEETFKWNNEEYLWNGGYDDVLAWMPLPEPWKGADDEQMD